MIPAQPQTIKQSLNKAYRLIKPKRASMEAFKVNLVKLLWQIDEKASGENVIKYVQDWLEGTYFINDYSQLENNSSPVCYAHISGLREGFNDSILPDTKPADTNSTFPNNTSISSTKAINLDLKEVLQITKFCIWEIAHNWQAYQHTNKIVLERQIDELVYQLYELTPEEVAIVEGR